MSWGGGILKPFVRQKLLRHVEISNTDLDVVDRCMHMITKVIQLCADPKLKLETIMVNKRRNNTKDGD